MTLQRPLYMQAASGDSAFSYTASQDRMLVNAIFQGQGVIAGLLVTQRGAGANMSVDISAGHCVIIGSDAVSQYAYMCLSDAVENRTIPAAPGAGTRTHRVVARIKDKLHNAAWPANTYEWTLEVLEDTGTGLPALPASAITLASVSVSAGQVTVLNSHITEFRTRALFYPGSWAHVAASSSERPASPRIPEQVWRTDLKSMEMWDGVAWKETLRTGTWATFIPTWTAATVNPTLGNGVLQGRWIRQGSMVTVQVYLRAGSTTTFGTGFWRFALPSAVTARTIAGTNMAHSVGSAILRDNSGANHQEAACLIDTTGSLAVIKDDTLRSTFPWTWATSDELLAMITYEVT